MSVVCNWCWASPAQSFTGPSPAELMTTFYCLNFETLPTWRPPYLYLPGTGWPVYTPRHWVPFSSPPATRSATVEVFDSAFTRGSICSFLHLNTLKNSVFWDITPCIPLKVNRCLRGTCRLHLQGRRISQARNQHARRWQLEGCFLAGLILRP
jgi:hypothetical protein